MYDACVFELHHHSPSPPIFEPRWNSYCARSLFPMLVLNIGLMHNLEHVSVIHMQCLSLSFIE